MEYLTNLYNSISGDPLIIIALLAVLIVLGYAIVKKLFKVAAIVIICVVAYLGYIAFTEGSDAAIDTLNDSVNRVLSEDAKNDLNNLKNQVINKTGEIGDQILDLIDVSPDSSKD